MEVRANGILAVPMDVICLSHRNISPQIAVQMGQSTSYSERTLYFLFENLSAKVSNNCLDPTGYPGYSLQSQTLPTTVTVVVFMVQKCELFRIKLGARFNSEGG